MKDGYIEEDCPIKSICVDYISYKSTIFLNHLQPLFCSYALYSCTKFLWSLTFMFFEAECWSVKFTDSKK